MHGVGMRVDSVDDSPHGGTVEVHQHPLIRIEIKRVSVLNSFQEMLELRTDQRASGVGGVDV